MASKLDELDKLDNERCAVSLACEIEHLRTAAKSTQDWLIKNTLSKVHPQLEALVRVAMELGRCQERSRLFNRCDRCPYYKGKKKGGH